MTPVDIFIRLLGFVYFCAFGAFIFQIKGLLGKEGILPITRFLDFIQVRYSKEHYRLKFPTLFWFNNSDKALLAVVYSGTFLSVLLMFGIYPPPILLMLYILYLSIVTVGQIFLGYGWEGFLLEVTAHAFLLTLTPIPDIMVWLSVNFLIFRFHFQAGAVKIQSKDANWRNLTAISYHYETQPLPNTTAYYIYRAPMWFHKMCCAGMFFIELALPFALFFGPEARLAAFIGFTGLQFTIWATGNLSFLNYLTVTLCTLLIAPQPTEQGILMGIIGSLYLALQIIQFTHHFFPRAEFERILAPFHPYYIGNRYGIFAVMTTKRYEIVTEGSLDGKEWKEYIYKYKPSLLNWRPRRISPYQPRIDWQAWFLPFRDYMYDSWYQNFLAHLLKNTPDVIKLLRFNPFPDQPPNFIRSKAYLYKFTTFKEKKETGNWWKREYAGFFGPTISLKKDEK